MYLDYFKLKAEPFGITPDPDFLFPSPSHKEALASVVYGVRMRKGFVSVTGETGVGKTTVIRAYLDGLDKKSVKVVYLFNSNITFSVLLKTIFRELGLEAKSENASAMIDQLHGELIEYYRNNVNVVLIIDEAQNMPAGTLENLRMLSNIETSKEKLLQIIFCGQPEFDRLLERHELRQLRQRIAVKVSIRRLSGRESRAYIRYRLNRASAKSRALFTSAAAMLIARKSKGIPRTINILCGNALVTAFGYRKRVVGYREASEAVADMEGSGRSSPVLVFGGALLVLLLAIAGLLFVPAAVSDFETMFSKRFQAVSGHLAPGNGTNVNDVIKATPVQPVNEKPEHRAAVSSVNKEIPAVNVRRNDADDSNRIEVKTGAVSVKRHEVVSKVVGRGDTLTRLATEVYGYSNDEVIARVARYNPEIKDVNIIFEGDYIAFPVN